MDETANVEESDIPQKDTSQRSITDFFTSPKQKTQKPKSSTIDGYFTSLSKKKLSTGDDLETKGQQNQSEKGKSETLNNKSLKKKIEGQDGITTESVVKKSKTNSDKKPNKSKKDKTDQDDATIKKEGIDIKKDDTKTKKVKGKANKLSTKQKRKDDINEEKPVNNHLTDDSKADDNTNIDKTLVNKSNDLDLTHDKSMIEIIDIPDVLEDDSIKKNDITNNCSTDVGDTSMEMSYEEFLKTPTRKPKNKKTLEKTEPSADNDCRMFEEKTGSGDQNSKNFKNVKTETGFRLKSDTQLNLGNANLKDPLNYGESDLDPDLIRLIEKDDHKTPSIKNFFKKVSQKPTEKVESRSGTPNTVTTKAVVHTSPTNSPESRPQSRMSLDRPLSPESVHSNVSVGRSKIDLSITQLGSEIINAANVKDEETSPSGKKLIENMDDYNEEELSCDDQVRLFNNKFNGENTEDVKPKKLSDFFTCGINKDVKPKVEEIEKVTAPSKTKQATLGFRKDGGFEVKKAETTKLKKKTDNSDRSEKDTIENKPKKRGRPKKIKEENSGSEVSKSKENIETEKPQISGKRKSKRILEKESESSQERSDIEEFSTLSKSKKRRKTYKMCYIDDPNRTPLRVRISRLNKSSSQDEADAKPVQQTSQQKKANKLLQKAKSSKQSKLKVKHTSKNKKTKVEKEGKSSKSQRKSVKTDIPPNVPRTPKHKKANPNSSTPKSSSKMTAKRSTPAKKGVKLASIFLKKPKTSPTTNELLQIVDPEVVKERQAFLLSGVPEEIKKQQTSSTVISTTEFQAFSMVDHIQQRPLEGDSLWDLSSPRLNLKAVEDTKIQPSKTLTKGHVSLSCCDDNRDCRVNINFCEHPAISDSTRDVLLSEIKRRQPDLPVKRLYKLFTSRYKQNEDFGNCNNTEDAYDAKPGEKRKLKEDQPITNKRKKLSTSKKKSGQGEEALPRRSSRRSLNNMDSEVVPTKEKDPEKATQDKYAVSDAENTIKGVTKEPSPEELSKRTMHWTEKYQPSKATEIIGQQHNVKKLSRWLQEWKERTNKEAKKLKIQLLKEAKKAGKNKEQIKAEAGDAWDDDSDFDIDASYSEGSDGEEEEDDGLCNTTVICGPHGIGKTSVVYALAQDLGYKVFEVNASSCRNGKRVMSQLQEATQSHQVSKNHLEKSFSFNSTSGKSNSQDTSTKAAPPAAGTQSVANFFTKKIPSINTEKAPPKKRGRKPKEESPVKQKKEKSHKKSSVGGGLTNKQGPTSLKGLNLSSVSLILFEEVDVVLEEDKGFLAAVQQFIVGTKRPIIMTTSDPYFSSKLDRRFEELKFRQPSFNLVASYLQTLSLAENFLVDNDALCSLVELNRGDIRKSILATQFWAESGGALTDNTQPYVPSAETHNAKIVVDENKEIEKVDDHLANTTEESDDDFQLAPRTRRKPRNLKIMDESSCDNILDSPVKTPQSSDAKPALGGTNAASINASMKTLPGEMDALGHSCCVESLLGMTSVYAGKPQSTFNAIQNPDMFSASEALNQMSNVRGNLMYNNLYSLLPLPTQLVSRDKYRILDPSQVLQRSRIRDNSDIFESDSENEQEFDTLKNKGVCDTEKCSDVKEGNIAVKIDIKSTPGDIHKKRLVSNSLDSISKLLDTLSYMDSFTTPPDTNKIHGSKLWNSDSVILQGGLLDELPAIGHSNDLARDINSTIEVMSLKKCSATMIGVLKQCEGKDDVLERLTLPVVTENRLSFSSGLIKDSWGSVNMKMHSNITECLPLGTDHSVISTDYTPILRLICKTEQCRQAAKCKRRFFHYLEQIQIYLRQSTIDNLCAT
ncbi:unnamed protein product [Owenia fusiformis]|uniref:Uncharacterized protein n=1 Tax=Owenia fusiformis TaxID=6347 RepID=A0A8J1UL85_OWEFU|nr:unnamed protein product [Owenia fusiformis]